MHLHLGRPMKSPDMHSQRMESGSSPKQRKTEKPFNSKQAISVCQLCVLSFRVEVNEEKESRSE